MKSAAKSTIVLVTAPDLKTARVLAKTALRAKLIACANLVALEKLILDKHPYDTPEFLVLPLSAGNKNYLGWLAENCH